jgi:uncharacterized membrane protein
VKFALTRIRHRAFQVGIVLKGLDGALEVVFGAPLLLTKLQRVQETVWYLTRSELIENPDNLLANFAVNKTEHLSIGTLHFAGAYLLCHGLIKVGLAIGLLRGFRWSYPSALLFLVTFIVYQLYRIYHTHSLTLSFFTTFDIAIALLIWIEWTHARNRS